MPRVIKRYENRKLYDTEASAYVSLRDIAALVRQGATVQVVDNVTGEDLTAQTLTQIILEEGKRGTHVLPTDLLHDLLRRSTEAVDSSLDRLRQGVDGLVQSSLGRISQMVQEHRPEAKEARPNELEHLRERMRALEAKLNRLLGDLDDLGDPHEGPSR